jgi:hypothetical protein
VTAVLTVYPNGASAGKPGMPNHKAKRSVIGGWSLGSARRNKQFLMSVDGPRLLDGAEGYAFTFTVRDCPPSPAAWQAAIERFQLQMRRRHGSFRAHWVIEWQKRQVPHLHGCLFFPRGQALSADEIVNGWCYLVGFGASPSGQHVKPLSDAPVGWFEYVSKHASRGVKHYQRGGEAIPPQWRGRTGRMWGFRGEWPLIPPIKLGLETDRAGGDKGYYAYRRLVRSVCVAQARVTGDVGKLTWARRLLRCPDDRPGHPRSASRGVSQWCPSDITQELLRNLRERGFRVSDLSPRGVAAE